jgi:hypothetical protein
MKMCVKIEDQTLEREKSCVFLLKIFYSDVQVPEHIRKQLEAPFRKIWGQNISLKDPNPKKICGSESEKMSSDPQH